jgi:hypothetical protein
VIQPPTILKAILLGPDLLPDVAVATTVAR